MAAPQKNSNASKWTKKRVIQYLNKLEEAATENNSLFIGQELKKLGLYPDIWSYWKGKFYENDNILERILRIESIFECNVFEAGLAGEIPARVAILTLRNAHGWRSGPVDEEEEQEIKVVKMEPATEASKTGTGDESRVKRA